MSQIALTDAVKEHVQFMISDEDCSHHQLLPVQARRLKLEQEILASLEPVQNLLNRQSLTKLALPKNLWCQYTSEVKTTTEPTEITEKGDIFIRRTPSTKRFTLKLISNPRVQVP